MFILQTEGSVRLCITDIYSLQVQWFNWCLWEEKRQLQSTLILLIQWLIITNQHPLYLFISTYFWTVCCWLSLQPLHGTVCLFRTNESELECPTGTNSSFQALWVVKWGTESRLLFDYGWLKCGLCQCLLFLDWFLLCVCVWWGGWMRTLFQWQLAVIQTCMRLRVRISSSFHQTRGRFICAIRQWGTEGQ